MKITCVSKSVSGLTMRYQLECDSSYCPILRGHLNNKLVGFSFFPEGEPITFADESQENIEVVIATPAGELRFASSFGSVSHDTEIEYLYPAEFTTDLTDHSGAIYDAGMQEAFVEVDGVSIPYKIWNVFSPYKEVLPVFEFVYPETQTVRKFSVPGFKWDPRTGILEGEGPAILHERMSAMMAGCMTYGLGRYTGEEVSASVREGHNRRGEFIHLQKWDIKNGMTHHMSWIPHFKEATARCFVPTEITYTKT